MFFSRSIKTIGGMLLFGLFLSLTVPSRSDDFLAKGQKAFRSKDYAKAFESYKLAAQKGDPNAMADLGLLYEKGLGTKQDYAEAFKWFTRGARKGDAEAQNNLGYLYLNGLGVPKDASLALQWFQRSAGQGLASARGKPGVDVRQGSGHPQGL